MVNQTLLVSINQPPFAHLFIYLFVYPPHPSTPFQPSEAHQSFVTTVGLMELSTGHEGPVLIGSVSLKCIPRHPGRVACFGYFEDL